MKSKLVFILTGILFFSFPALANAKTNVMGGPYSNLKSSDQIIHLALSSYPTSNGLYVLQCVQPAQDSRPTVCNQSVQLWISNTQGANFAPNADIQFKPTATFTSGTNTVDCTKSVCGIFIRLDHTAPTDTSEDQFIPIKFAAETAPVLPSDQITATIDGASLSTSTPFEAKYRNVYKVEASTKSGLTTTYASLAPACAINGNEITVLKGSGYCDIAVTSTGNSRFSGLTAHFPIKLSPGDQKVNVAAIAKLGTKMNLPVVTNFGEPISYSLSKSLICSLKSHVLTLQKKGTCNIKLTAQGLTDTYLPLNTSVNIRVK